MGIYVDMVSCYIRCEILINKFILWSPSESKRFELLAFVSNSAKVLSMLLDEPSDRCYYVNASGVRRA